MSISIYFYLTNSINSLNIFPKLRLSSVNSLKSWSVYLSVNTSIGNTKTDFVSCEGDNSNPQYYFYGIYNNDNNLITSITNGFGDIWKIRSN